MQYGEREARFTGARPEKQRPGTGVEANVPWLQTQAHEIACPSEPSIHRLREVNAFIVKSLTNCVAFGLGSP